MGMWWEIVPVFSLCVGLSFLPNILTRGYNKLCFGTQYERALTQHHAWYLYQRDRDHSAPGGPMSKSLRYYNCASAGEGHKVGADNIYYSNGLEKYD